MLESSDAGSVSQKLKKLSGSLASRRSGPQHFEPGNIPQFSYQCFDVTTILEPE